MDAAIDLARRRGLVIESLPSWSNRVVNDAKAKGLVRHAIDEPSEIAIAAPTYGQGDIATDEAGHDEAEGDRELGGPTPPPPKGGFQLESS